MNIDSNSLKGTQYKTVEEYQNDLKEIDEKLNKIAKAAKKKDETYKNSVHKEIQTLFEKTIIESDLKNILGYVSEFGQIRYSHKLPPGFEDEKKELNLFGDLIIWLEILECCKAKNFKKAILITNDNKKDWVYAPSKILDNSRPMPNLVPQFKIVDPRLVYEFKSITASEEFYIINFESLTQILIQKSKGGFIELAKALQIATFQEAEVAEEADFNKENIILEEQLPQEEIQAANNTENEIYSEYALADSSFPTDDASFGSETIENLKSHNWYVQNPTLKKFLKADLPRLIKETQKDKDKLFVIGRNIYQSACGGSGTAIDTIENLEEIFIDYNDFIITHLYAGMLYEVYFNSYNVEDYTKLCYIKKINMSDSPRFPHFNAPSSKMRSFFLLRQGC